MIGLSRRRRDPRHAEARIRSMQDDLKDIDRDIDDAHAKVQMAERMQWSVAMRARETGVGKSMAVIAIVQRIKSNAKKEIRQMQEERRHTQDRIEAEREAQREQQREAEEAERQQEQERARRREREERERELERDDDRDM